MLDSSIYWNTQIFKCEVKLKLCTWFFCEIGKSKKKYIQKVTSCYIGAARKQGIQSYENLVIHSVVHYINPSNLSEYKNYNIVHNHQYQYIQYTQHRKIYFSVLSKPTPEINICIQTIFVFISHFTSPLALDKRDWRVQLIL